MAALMAEEPAVHIPIAVQHMQTGLLGSAPLRQRLLMKDRLLAKWAALRRIESRKKWRGDGEKGLKRAVRSFDQWLDLRHDLGRPGVLGDPRDWSIAIYLEIAQEFGVDLTDFVYLHDAETSTQQLAVLVSSGPGGRTGAYALWIVADDASFSPPLLPPPSSGGPRRPCDPRRRLHV